MAVIMVPAGERLEAGDAARCQLDQRLKGQTEPIFFDRVAQRGFKPEAIVRKDRGLGFVNFDPVGLLRAFERDLRMTNLVSDSGVNCRLNRTAKRLIDADFQFADAKGVIEASADAPRHFADIGSSARNA